MATEQKNHNVAVVVPVFNESGTIARIINELKCEFDNIYVVDDGSSDLTSEIIFESGLIPIIHSVNLGQGAALQTGLSAGLLNKNIKYFLTFDGDGQHLVADALRLFQTIQNLQVDVVLGSRFCSGAEKSTIPLKKRVVLKIGLIFTRFNSGLKVTDTHNGLRIMSRNFVETLNIRQNRMAHASEILNHINSTHSKWIEIPVNIKYTKYSNKKGQSILNSINIITELMHK